MDKKRIGIYGGTFSPPHIGHVGAAESFSRAISPDELLIMPDFLPPHKQYDGEVTAEDRLEMSKLAFGHIENAFISDMEIKRGGKSFTSVTLEELTSPNSELYFLCGTDMFVTLEEWYRAPLIFKLAVICYVRRESDAEYDSITERLEKEYKEKYGARIIRIDSQVREISSTELRGALQSGSESARELLPEPVYDFIKERGLYR
ncbi:MAG: nicotinate (nicotinamide) nucleotide adenylyltransferase [Ruminococcaceae bacterium]|nr:nicotinate (nicotinamide) nucleotide adenylyltransferase [Oscillospiraceae bacterium]